MLNLYYLAKIHLPSFLYILYSPYFPFIVLEYCEFGSLHSWIGSSNAKTALIILNDISKALFGIHAANGFHRDIKPQNILISKETPERIIFKLSDFGLARLPPPYSRSMTNTAWGTQGYMAPEILNNNSFSTKSDIYSLGITLIELMTGNKNRISLDQIQIPDKFKKLILSMTAFNPDERLTINQVLWHINDIMQTCNFSESKESNSLKPWMVFAFGVGILALFSSASKPRKMKR
jgi:serine/threonine protein kinase